MEPSVEAIVLKNFKSFKNKNVLSGFAPGVNLILGKNGSGKSNVYLAVSLIFDARHRKKLNFAQVKKILHDGGKSSTRSYVSISVKNNGVICIIKRKMSLQDDYFVVDKTKVGMSELVSFIESKNSKLSAYFNSSLFIVPQETVTSLATCDNSDRLGMFKNCLPYITECEKKVTKSKNYLTKIQNDVLPRINQLFDELSEKFRLIEQDQLTYNKYQKLLLKKLLVSKKMLISEKDSKKDADKLFKDFEVLNTFSYPKICTEVERLTNDIYNLNDKLVAVNKNLLEKNFFESTKTPQKVTTIKQLVDNQQDVKKSEKMARIQNVEKIIVDTMDRVNGLDTAAKNNVERNLTKIIQKIKQNDEATKSVQNSIAELTSNLSIANEKIKNSLKLVNSERINQLNIKKGQVVAEQKKIFQTLANHIETVRMNNSIVDKCTKKLYENLPRSVLYAVQSINSIKSEFGINFVIDYLQCDETFNTAIEVIAAKYLFFIVVEDDEQTEKIISHFNRSGMKGELNFMPAAISSKAKTKKVNKMDDCVPLLSLVKGEKHKNIFEFILGDTVLCKDFETAKKVCKVCNAVTIDGDKILNNGVISGGYYNRSNSVIGCYNAIKRKMVENEEIEREKKICEEELDKILQQLQQVNLDLQEEEQRIFGSKKNLEGLKNSVKILTDKINSKQIQLEKHITCGEAYSKEKFDLINTFNFDKKKNSFSLCIPEEVFEFMPVSRQEYADLSLNRHEVCAILEQALSKVILKKAYLKKKMLINSVSDSGVAVSLTTSNNYTNSNENTNLTEKSVEQKSEEKQRVRAQINECKNELAKKMEAKTNMKQELLKMQKELSEFKKRKTLLSSEILKLNEQIKEHAEQPHYSKAVEKVEKTEKNLEGYEKKIKNKIDFINSKINSKVIEQYNTLNTQVTSIKNKLTQFDSDRTKISALVDKIEEVQNTILTKSAKEVTQHFNAILNELFVSEKISSLDVQLQLERDDSNTTGLSISLSTHRHTKSKLSVNSLSGGQKSVLALSFLFSLQRFFKNRFYFFDEVDSALDLTHREAFANFVFKQKDHQFICTTFRPELIQSADCIHKIEYDTANKCSRVEQFVSKESALALFN